jgi:hypothetical protein
MSDTAAMLGEIRATLGSAISPNLTTASAGFDIFEAYVLSLILRAAQVEEATISYEDVFGGAPSIFVFRTSPGEISQTTQPYTHAIIQFTNKPLLEAHIGIYIEGKSGVRHECDVAVLLRTEAETCRRNPRVLPRHTKVILSAECKFYTGNVPLPFARSFLGLRTDISHSNGSPFYVLNTDSPSGIKLVEHHYKGWEKEIVPRLPIAVARLQNAFQKTFQSFKTRN